ncbi:cytochrome P450 [Pisolithus orientalis]|uniref:cytochrome P450 n=1 Tax=Pisolithus orientalis TaxID=936130 RepID=UPI002224F285|nr:cytochrome P450 [Pisolithus orientalis]KAI6025692.1 cytochrome P450 [Pisolithus orientalis]
MHTVSLAAFSALLICLAFAVKRWGRRALRNGLPLPPGPKGLPLVGNLLDINFAAPWTTYEQWGKRYGGISYCTVLGQGFVIINDEEIAHELILKRPSIYSDRPPLCTNELFGLDFNTGFLPYGDEWRLHRRMYNVAFSQQITKKYQLVQMSKVHQLLVNLLSTPLDYPNHFATLSTAIIMAISAAGTATTSFVGDLFEMEIGNDLVSFKDEAVKAVAATVFLAGAETTSSALLVFLLAMVLYPETQVKAQEEIDRVVGDARLPEFKDREHLPYVEALLIETLRWKPIVPLMLRHTTTAADVCHGMYIPKGKPSPLTAMLHLTRLHLDTTVVVNYWAITRNEVRYPNPAAFNPERHLTAGGTLAEGTAPPYFGLGRRICPGKYVAEQSIWAAMVSILATLRIGKARDDAGREIDFTPVFTTGMTSHPKPFRCSIEARSPRAAELIYASISAN